MKLDSRIVYKNKDDYRFYSSSSDRWVLANFVELELTSCPLLFATIQQLSLWEGVRSLPKITTLRKLKALQLVFIYK